MAEELKRKVPPRPNVYSVLTFVACVVLAVGIGFLIKFSTQVTGEKSPWFVAPKPGATAQP